MRSSRIARGAGLLALALALAVSCGGDDGPAADADATEEKTIEFLVFGEPEELRAYRELVRSFRPVAPDVRVDLVEASDRSDLLTRLSTAIAAGDPPDLFLVNYRFYAQFAVTDAIEPVQDRLDGSDAFAEGDFYPEALDAFRAEAGGDLVCLPQNVSSLEVYFNRALFEEAGVPEPTAGWTWDDMVDAARRLTADTDGDGRTDQFGLTLEPTLIRLAPFVWSNGGEVVGEGEDRLALDRPPAAEALQRFLDLRAVDGVVPSAEEVAAEDDESRFVNGRAAMLLSSRRVTPTLRTIQDFDWDVGPLPVHRRPAGILHSDAYCLAAGGDTDTAWRFVEHALGPPGQSIVARIGRTVPSLRETATSEAFLTPQAKPASSQVFLDAIPTIRRVPGLSTWPEIEDVADTVLAEAFEAGTPAPQVAAELVARTEEIFARAERP